MTLRFQARRCSSPECGLRFPIEADSRLGDRCPLCQAETTIIGPRYNTEGATAATAPPNAETRPRIAALLDNVRSLRNVGAIFRCADGAGIDHLYLCGFTPTPDNPKLQKTALGAEHSVSWSRHLDATKLAHELQSEGHKLWAIEGGQDVPSLFDLNPSSWPPVSNDRASDPQASHDPLANHAPPNQNPLEGPIVLVLGHEVSGIDAELLSRCDQTFQLPMLGHKSSLNVSVAFGIVAYTLRFAFRQAPG